MHRLKLVGFNLALPVFWILGLMLSFELAHRLTLSLLAQEFRDWNSIGSPPGGASSIVGAGQNDLWVKLKNGQTYVFKLDCIHTDKCRAWFPLSDLPEFEAADEPGGVRLADCAVAGSPRVRIAPPGIVEECFRSTYFGSDQPGDVYYAITTDGAAYFVWVGIQPFEELALTAVIGLISSTVLLAIITMTHSRLRNLLVGTDAGG